MSRLRANCLRPGRPKKGPRERCHPIQKNWGPCWDAIQPRESGRELTADLLMPYEVLSALREIRTIRAIRQEGLLRNLNGQGPEGQARSRVDLLADTKRKCYFLRVLRAIRRLRDLRREPLVSTLNGQGPLKQKLRKPYNDCEGP